MNTSLPFLQPRGWPQKAKIVGESKYGFDEDDDMVDQALDELIAAIEAKDHRRSLAAVRALLQCLESHEGAGDADLQEAP